jgi:hypothetical protein
MRKNFLEKIVFNETTKDTEEDKDTEHTDMIKYSNVRYIRNSQN